MKRRKHGYKLLHVVEFSLLLLLCVILAGALLAIDAQAEPEKAAESSCEPVQAEAGNIATEYSTVPPDTELPAVQPLGEFLLTAYCPCERCCGRWADGITATGTQATEGRTIAVDPEVIPYGSAITLIWEDGRMETYIAEDCGGGVKDKHIDIYFSSHADALAFGVQSAMAYWEEAAP